MTIWRCELEKASHQLCFQRNRFGEEDVVLEVDVLNGLGLEFLQTEVEHLEGVARIGRRCESVAEGLERFQLVTCGLMLVFHLLDEIGG